MHLAYRSAYTIGNGKIEHTNTYDCTHLFASKKRYESHLKNCSGNLGM